MTPGDNSPRLILPGEFPDSSGLLRVRASVPPTTGREDAIAREIFGRGPVIAVTNPPSFFDQVHVYATHQQLYEFMLEPELASYLDFGELTVEDVITRVRALPFEPAFYLLSSLQKAISFGRADQEWQRQLMHEVYGDTVISLAGEAFLRANDRAAIFSEQQLFALQRLLVLYASDEEVDSLTKEQDVSLRLALFQTPGTVLTLDDNLESEAPETIADERWLRFFVGNGGFAAQGSLRHDMARAHRIYEVIANSNHARKKGHPDYCPLADWLEEEYRMSFVELQAFGFAMHAGSRTVFQDGAPLAVTPGYFATTLFADRVEDGFRAFAADRAWFKEEFERSAENPRRAAFETQPFLRRPGLLLRNGNVAVIAPRAIEAWMSATGAYYRLFDIARGKSDVERNRFTRFNGTLQEIYVRHLAHVAYPYPEQRGAIAVGKVYGEQPYLKRKQNLLTSDVLIDLGLDLVLLEVTAKRLTEKTLVEADAESVRADLQMMIVKKMQQLGRVIGDVFEDPTRLPVIELQYVQRVWPMVVAAEGLFHNPTIWAYTDTEAGDALRFERSQVKAQVMPVVLLDLEEVEALFGLVAADIPLTTLLERKTSPLWLERDFKAMITEEFGHRWDGLAPFVSQEQRRAFRAIRHELGIRQQFGVSTSSDAEEATDVQPES